MNRCAPMVFAALCAIGPISASARDLVGAEAAELQARDDRLIAQRERGVLRVQDSVPMRPQGDIKLDRDRGEVKADRQTTDVKPPKSRGVKAKGSERKTKRAKRTLRDLPGALVRGR